MHEDEGLVNYLRMQAKNEKSGIDFIDMGLRAPFRSDNAEYIKQGIRARIARSSVTVVMVTDKTSRSHWINWEVEETMRQGRGVVAIDKRSSRSSRMPNAINRNRNKVKIVPWKEKEVMEAIDKAAEGE